MSTSPSLPSVPQQQQPLQHHHHQFRRVEEQQEQQNRHIERLEQYRQNSILPSHSHYYAHHPHPYHPFYPYHNVHSPQPQSSSSHLPPLPIEHQTSPIDPSSQQDSAFYLPTHSWQQLSPVHHQHQYQPSLSKQGDPLQPSSSLSPAHSNLQQLLFDEDPVRFEGFSVPPEFAWDPLAESGSSPLTASAGPDLYSTDTDTSSYFFSTSNLSIAQEDNTVAAAAMAVAGSSTHSTTLFSRRAASRHQPRSLKMRINRRIDMYREPEKQDAGQPNNNNSTNNNKTQIILPLQSSEWYGSLSPPAAPLSPPGMVDTNEFHSSLIQSLANLTTSSPNLTCLSPPVFSSALGQNSFAFPESQRCASISSDHLSGPNSQSNKGINNSKSNDGDGGDNSKATAEKGDDESDRQFRCPVCPKRFLRQYNLNAHLKTHSQVRAHACTQCDKSFLRPYDLSRHQRIHSNSKPYTCNICQLIFIRNDAIWRHYRRVHPGHPDVPPARHQRRPQRTSTTNISDNNNNTFSALYSSITSPIRSTSAKSASSPTCSPHDITSHVPVRSPSDTFSSYPSPSRLVAFTSKELSSLDKT